MTQEEQKKQLLVVENLYADLVAKLMLIGELNRDFYDNFEARFKESGASEEDVAYYIEDMTHLAKKLSRVLEALDFPTNEKEA